MESYTTHLPILFRVDSKAPVQPYDYSAWGAVLEHMGKMYGTMPNTIVSNRVCKLWNMSYIYMLLHIYIRKAIDLELDT